MADFTVNTITTKGEWLVADAYSTDISTADAILEASTGNEYLLKSISVTMADSDGRWFKVLDDTTLRIGPVRPYNRQWYREYKSPIKFAGAINIQTETDRKIHVSIEYKIRTITKP